MSEKIRPRRLRLVALLPILLILLALGGCGSDKIIFLYPDEQLDMRLQGLQPAALYIDEVNDMRPVLEREGEGHFFHIRFPKDASWYRPATEIYAEALVQDIRQTHLAELVSYREQAEYFLSVDILSLSCTFDRSALSYAMPGALGLGVGMMTSDDTSHRISTGIALGLVAIATIPMPSQSEAQTEVRITIKDRQGNIVFRETCQGQAGDRVYATATARQDQEYVDRFLTRAVKRANACLLGQLRPKLIELGTTAAN